jgi:hypothetical protein
MLEMTRVRRDGPHVHVTLPDVLPPDWVSIRCDVAEEVDDGVETVFVDVPGSRLSSHDERELADLDADLIADGIKVRHRYGSGWSPEVRA